jgi:hypothetical protein
MSYQSDLTNELSTAGGYTANGATLASKTVAYTAAASATAWANGHAYNVGDIVRASTSNGHIYICTVAGTSGGSEPTWTTVSGAQQSSDNGVIWLEYGRGFIKFSCAAIQWTSSGTGITARYAVVYDSSGGSTATNALILYIDFGSDQTANNGGTFTITPNTDGLWTVGIPY